MTDFDRTDPRLIDAILDWKFTWLFARVAIVAMFVVSGVLKMLDFPAAIAEQENHGLHPGAFWAITTIVVQLAGSALILAGRYVWLGAGALGIFTALAAVLAHPFWTLHGQERFVATNVFLEHIGLIGGFIMAALVAEHAKRDGRY